ncbi:uncharacterized mitochondrial protein AtMg00810-like [Solanum verrucosum]|uniref:uncharacterized mitochondrial protein AtMg00810-like n=1 Tax=Solanum verrucosum TaxID=315347 RepID=UPI0020D1526A|nr:uncharacterized mitochondrial protein AtMg00810-like [Solanum verrucosum]
MGFIMSESDASLFILKNLVANVYVLVYVDDILITGSHPSLIRHVINSLGSRFSMKDLSYLDYFLGVGVKKVPGGLILSQSKYILDILSELDIQDCKGVVNPMCSGKLPRAVDRSPPANATLYRRTLGARQNSLRQEMLLLQLTKTAPYKRSLSDPFLYL